MRVGIDDPGHDHATSGVSDNGGVAVNVADRDDLAVADGDIGNASRCSGTVDDGSTLNEFVVGCVGHSGHLS